MCEHTLRQTVILSYTHTHTHTNLGMLLHNHIKVFEIVSLQNFLCNLSKICAKHVSLLQSMLFIIPSMIFKTSECL